MAQTGPIRMCLICRQRFSQTDLLRHVCPEPEEADGLVPDPGRKRPGRGFYVCNDKTCRQRFEKYSGWRRKCKGV